MTATTSNQPQSNACNQQKQQQQQSSKRCIAQTPNDSPNFQEKAHDILDAVRTNVLRSYVAARAAQQRALDFSGQLPFINRFSAEYIRGASEVLGTVATIGLLAVFVRNGTYRFKVASDIPKRFFRPPRTIHGYVLNVSDGDGVRFYHTPFFHRMLSSNMRAMRKYSNETISVRLAGVDAPEVAHFGLPGQRFGKIAKEWLTQQAHRRRATLELLGQDQYNRIVGMVHVKHNNPLLRALGIGRKNLSLELVRAGYAEVYRGPNALYGRLQARLEFAEKRAIQAKRGFWADKKELTPTDFKKKMRRYLTSDQPQDQSAVLLPGPLLSKTLAVLKGIRDAANAPSKKVQSKSKKRGSQK